MKTTHNPLYARCTGCAGTGEAPPDEGIHDAVPENSSTVKRHLRALRVCPSCMGRAFTQTPITDYFVRELIEEHNAALEVAQELVDTFAVAYLGDGAQYLSDPVLLTLNMRFETVLDRARRAGRREPERPALKKG